MAIVKTGYATQYTGRTSVKVGADNNGAIVPANLATKTRTLSVQNVNAENSLIANTTVLSAFLSFCNGTQDSLTNTASVTWEVA